MTTAVKLKKAGASDKDIAAAVGVCPQTFCTWQTHPRGRLQRELSEALKKAEADYKTALLKVVAKAAVERDWKAAAWILERKYPEEFAKKTIVEQQRAAEDAPKFTFEPGAAE